MPVISYAPRTTLTRYGVSSPAELSAKAQEEFYLNKKPYRSKTLKQQARRFAKMGPDGAFHSPLVPRLYHDGKKFASKGDQ